MSRTVVVGYVRTPEGLAAFDQGLAEAHEREARLVVVHVHQGAADDLPEIPSLEQELDAIRERFTSEGIDGEARLLPLGADPAGALLDVVDQVAADLLVIGLRRRSQVGKLVLGSNAQRLLMEANCPVLSVKPTPAD